MNHLPFETWITEEHVPTGEEKSLQEHLAVCPECRRLQRSWQSVRHMVQHAPAARPTPGFSQRWQAGLAEKRARQLRRQTILAFAYGGIAATVIFGLLALYLFATFSPAAIITGFVGAMVSVAKVFSLISRAAHSWFVIVPLPVNLTLWIALTSLLSLISLLWVATMWRFVISGVTQR